MEPAEDCQAAASTVGKTASEDKIEETKEELSSEALETPTLLVSISGLSGEYLRVHALQDCTVENLRRCVAQELRLAFQDIRLHGPDLRALEGQERLVDLGPADPMLIVTMVIVDHDRADWLARLNAGMVPELEVLKLPPRLRSDREVMMAAVQRNWEIFRYASPELRADREIAMLAIRRCGVALEYVSEELRGDRELVLEAVKHQWALSFASAQLRADKEVVLAAVKRSMGGSSLEFASEDLRGDPEVVLEAVRREGLALQFASEALRADRQVVMRAMQSHVWALRFAAEPLRADRQLVLAAIQRDGMILQLAHKDLQADKAVATAAVQQNVRALHWVDETLQASATCLSRPTRMCEPPLACGDTPATVEEGWRGRTSAETDHAINERWCRTH